MFGFARNAALALGLVALPAYGAVIDIDLNDFFADPSVTVSADGSMATFEESEDLLTVILSNDPGLGEEQVIIPSAGAILSFAYDFLEPLPDNDDEFAVFILDAASGLSVGEPFEFALQSSGAGVISFDLSSLVGQTLGLQFQMEALSNDIALTSTLKISDLKIDDGQIANVPEPGTAFLLLGSLGLIAVRRMKK